MHTLRTAYGPKKAVKISFPEQGRTKQAMQSQCDINQIMAKFQKTGVIDFVNKHSPQFGDSTGIDFQTSMETVARANEMFADLPSSVRKRFNNDPQELLEFCEDGENRQEAIKLGLLDRTHGRKADFAVSETRRKADIAARDQKRRGGDSKAPAEPKPPKKEV